MRDTVVVLLPPPPPAAACAPPPLIRASNSSMRDSFSSLAGFGASTMGGSIPSNPNNSDSAARTLKCSSHLVSGRYNGCSGFASSGPKKNVGLDPLTFSLATSFTFCVPVF